MDSKKKIIFIADDDPLFLKSLEIEFREDSDFFVRCFKTGEELIGSLSSAPDIIITDYYLNSFNKDAINGLKILDHIKENDPAIPVIILSSQDSIEVAINCTHHGAFDYIVKSETAFFRLRKSLAGLLLYEKALRSSGG